MYKTKSIKTAMFAAAFLILPTVFSDTISNGDFETTGNWTYSENNTYWDGTYDNSVAHGGSNSYKISLPASQVGALGDYADITQTITVPAASKFYEIDLWVKDDYTSRDLRRNYPFKQILVDGEVVWEDSVKGSETSSAGGWLHVVQDITTQLMGKSQADITLRTYQKHVSVGRSIDLSMMLKTSLADGGVALGAKWDDGTYNWAMSEATSDGTWTNINGNVLVPPGIKKARIWIYPFLIKNGDLWVDDITCGINATNTNTSFESGTGSLPDDWSEDTHGATNVVTWDSSEYYSGAKSIKVVNSVPKDNGGLWSSWELVNPGETLNLSMMLKTNLSKGYVLIGAKWDDGTYSWANSGTSSGTWSQLSGTVVVPSGVTKCRVWVYPWDITGSLWFDDVLMQRLPSINPGFETGSGSLPDKWSDDNMGLTTVTWDTSEYYSGAKSIKVSNSTSSEYSGGIWSDWIDLGDDTTSPVLTGVNVWWDDVSIKTDKDTTLETRRAMVAYGLGDYDNSVRSNGRIDIDTTIERLLGANVLDYNYLIWDTYDWDDLPDFLDAAYIAGIRVWVTLIPPAELLVLPGYNQPYGINFLPDDEQCDVADFDDHDGDNTDDWVTQIGQLSLTHPALVGFYIDDYINGGLDSHNFTMQLSTALHNINPNIAFMPCVYYYKKHGLKESPYYWATTNSESSWVRDVKHSGGFSLKINNTTSTVSSSWYGRQINFEAPYPETLTLGGWAKADNAVAGSSSPLFCLDFYIIYDDDTIDWYYSDTQFSYGTHDWENKEYTKTFSKGVKSVTPYCLFYNSSGTVWFDDIYVELSGTNKVVDPGAEANKDIKPYVDGIVFPYTDMSDYSNMSDNIDDMRTLLGDNKSLIAMVYGVYTTGSYIAGALTAAHENSNCDGVQVYLMPKHNTTNDAYLAVQAAYADWINPLDWDTYDNDLDNVSGWDRKICRSGLHSLKISKTSGDYALWLGKQYDFAYPYPTTLKFGGWAKADNAVAGTSPLFCLDFKIIYDDDTVDWYYSDMQFSYGTHDWENKEYTKTFSKGVKSVTPYCLFYNSTGTVWFDDIYVEFNGTNVLSNPGAETSE